MHWLIGQGGHCSAGMASGQRALAEAPSPPEPGPCMGLTLGTAALASRPEGPRAHGCAPGTAVSDRCNVFGLG